MVVAKQRPKTHLSTALLVSVGLFDLLTTIAWLNMGGQEGNRYFARLWEQSPPAFVAMKLVFLFGPVAILEWARKKSPKSAEQGTWLAFGFYVLFWGSHVIGLGRMLAA